jgi:hypothetical protein
MQMYRQGSPQIPVPKPLYSNNSRNKQEELLTLGIIALGQQLGTGMGISETVANHIFLV